MAMYRNQGGYAGMAGDGVFNDMDVLNAQRARDEAQQRSRDMADYQREMHERALQQQEQQRRNYDSETQRQVAQQRTNLLAGLLPQRTVL